METRFAPTGSIRCRLDTWYRSWHAAAQQSAPCMLGMWPSARLASWEALPMPPSLEAEGEWRVTHGQASSADQSWRVLTNEARCGRQWRSRSRASGRARLVAHYSQPPLATPHWRTAQVNPSADAAPRAPRWELLGLSADSPRALWPPHPPRPFEAAVPWGRAARRLCRPSASFDY